jgi:hypothetical protein
MDIHFSTDEYFLLLSVTTRAAIRQNAPVDAGGLPSYCCEVLRYSDNLTLQTCSLYHSFYTLCIFDHHHPKSGMSNL